MPVPYAGNASNYPPDVDVLSGADIPNSTNFNTAYEGGLDRTAYLYAAAGLPGMNWRPEFGASSLIAGTTIFEAARWDSSSNLWLAGVSYDNAGTYEAHVLITYGVDDGSGWGQIGGGDFASDATGITCMSVVADPTTAGLAWAAAMTKGTGALIVANSAEVSGTWSTIRTVSTSTITSVELATLSSGVVMYVTGGTNSAGTVFSASSNGGSTWHDQGISGATIALWDLKSNGTMAILAPVLVVSPGFIFTTTDGVTLTPVAVNGFVGLEDEIVGLVWSSLTELWYMAVQKATNVSPASCAFYSSPTGATWTEVAVGPPSQLIADMNTVGNGLVCTLQDQTSRASGMIFSPDFGVTWYPSQAVASDNATSGSTGYTRSRLHASPTGLLQHNAKVARFSPLFGLPTALP